MSHNKGLIHAFIKHRVAANLLMFLMILAGLTSLFKTNIQFLPNFDINVINVGVSWPGASAEDVEKSLVTPLEKELRDIDNLKRIETRARQGQATVSLEFVEGTNLSKALETIRERVSSLSSLPQDHENPIITRIEPYETIARLLISGPNDLNELRQVSYQFERELLDLGIGKVTLVGLPTRELLIEITPQTLAQYKLSLPQISDKIAQQSSDIPAGKIGRSSSSQSIRTQQKKRSILDFEHLEILSDDKTQRLTLGDVAHIQFHDKEDDVKLFHKSKPAVELRLLRAQKDNTLESAKLVQQWLEKKQLEVGKSLQIILFKQNWQLIKQRIDTLVFNGLSGLALIIMILFLLLNRPIALWITLGIPTSVLASLWLLSTLGGSINMISLFAFILSFGIIVDDAIVVGEQTLTNIDHHGSVEQSVLNACKKMMPAILSSSLTTISAFFPLLFISGIIGTVLFDIPLVVICVISASLLECFFVLPGHLNHAFSKQGNKPTAFRLSVNQRFNYFRDNLFSPFVKRCLKHRFFVVCMTLSVCLVCLALIKGGHIKFTFFPSPDNPIIKAQVQFIPGTPQSKRLAFMHTLSKAADKAEKSFKKKYHLKQLIKLQYSMLNRSDINNYEASKGESYASHIIELISGDERTFNNLTFNREWRKHIQLPSFVDNLSITSPRGGPPGKDIDIQVLGPSTKQIKAALIELADYLHTLPGLSAVKDNLPYAQEQWLFEVNANGKALGLTTNDVGRQLRAAFNGETIQTYYTPHEDIDVKVILPEKERINLATLYALPIVTPMKTFTPLENVVDFKHKQSPDLILHTDTKLSANLTAEVDTKVNNSNEILRHLSNKFVKTLEEKHAVTLSFKGRAEEQKETLHDILIGLFLALTLIYIILAWVFNSYSLPLLVMLAIPLGLIGAIIGHLVMGLNLTLLSLFGLFGLSGIVINDSIILINEYNLLRSHGLSINRAITQAASLRLRAVLLTSITTIAGLSPLLFEKSLQAQFLIPMATSITFGLAFATILILIVIPSLVYLLESTKVTIKRRLR